MKKRDCSTEYTDKYWDYSKGYEQVYDPYEIMVKEAEMPVNYQTPKKKTGKTPIKQRKKTAKKQEEKQKPKTRKNVIETPTTIQNSRCFVSSSSNDLKITTKIITHPRGFQPDQIPLDELNSDPVNEEE